MVSFELHHLKGLKCRIIAKTIGVPAAINLLEKLSLQRVYINDKPSPDSEASLKLGHDVHEALSREFPAQEIIMPNFEEIASAARREQRNIEIYQARYQAKKTVQDIAIEFQVTIRTVEKVLSKFKELETQSERASNQEQHLQYELF